MPPRQPLTSLLASAQRLTAEKMSRPGTTNKTWQEDAWEMYDLVGEQRFLAATLAGRLSQARLYVGQLSEDLSEAPTQVDDPRISDILGVVGGSASGRAQLIGRLGINLFVAGDGWLAGIPKRLFPPSLLPSASMNVDPELLPEPADDSDLLAIEDLEWRMLSVSEVTSRAGGEVTLALGAAQDEAIVCSPDDIFLIRVWRPHPRRWWEADSPTRSSLPVLRELVGLTMHISAQVDSRLAGAGLLIVPQSAQRALQVAAGLDDELNVDQFTEALMEAMLTPINDRANASALVPLVVTVPDEATQLFQFITFAKPLDSEARSLRDEAIRRLALGQDAPPELLLGTSGMNHWGAWLVQEDVVTTHLEPPLALICDALTVQYLWPVLMDQGMTLDEARNYVIWYDVSDLVVRPNHSTDAMTLHDRGALSDMALRTVTGFDESDAPETAELDLAIRLALEIAKTSPGMITTPGLPQVVAQLREVLADRIPDYEEPLIPTVPPVEDITAIPPVDEDTGPTVIPETDGKPAEIPPIPSIAASAHWDADDFNVYTPPVHQP